MKEDISEPFRSKRKSKKEVTNRNDRSSVTSYWSKNPQQKNISNAVRAALRIKYYRQSLGITFMILYLLIIAIFISQIVIKDTSDNTLTFIQTSKEIVRNAEMRNFLLVVIQQTSRLLWDMAIGKLNAQNLVSYNGPQWEILLLSIHLTNLRNTNQDLFKSVNSLDEKTRKGLFMKDVRMFETYYDDSNQIFETMDNFQATSRLVETGLKAINIMKNNLTEGRKEIQFLLRNSVNDLLLKNEMTSDVLTEAVKLKQNEISIIINAYLLIIIAFLILLSLLFIYAIWKQLKTEKNNMLAVVKLDPHLIRTSLERINGFRIRLEDEKSEQFDTLDALSDIVPEDFKKKQQMKKSNNTEIHRKYCFYVFKLLLLIILLEILVYFYSVSSKNAIIFSQEKQAQFFFMNRLKSKMTFAVTISEELFAANGTTQS